MNLRDVEVPNNGPVQQGFPFRRVLAFSPETCKFLIFPFHLHVDIIKMNGYAE